MAALMDRSCHTGEFAHSSPDGGVFYFLPCVACVIDFSRCNYSQPLCFLVRTLTRSLIYSD